MEIDDERGEEYMLIAAICSMNFRWLRTREMYENLT